MIVGPISRPFTMAPALKALLAQLAGWLAAFGLARSGLLPTGLWPLVAAQALCAGAAAAGLRSARWWLPIHLAFTPVVVVAHGADIAPGWYLAAFVVLLSIYWTSFRTQVPLYLSNRRTAEAVGRLLAPTPTRLLDIGAGTGSLLRPLARLRPDCRFTGIEQAPAPWLLGRALASAQANIDWRRGDLFTPSWADYDVVYAFLSPVPMAAVWDKARAEMRPGSRLLSNSFPVPSRKPDFVVEVEDARQTRLYGYIIPGRQAGK